MSALKTHLLSAISISALFKRIYNHLQQDPVVLFHFLVNPISFLTCSSEKSQTPTLCSSKVKNFGHTSSDIVHDICRVMSDK